MSLSSPLFNKNHGLMATAPAAAAPPSLLTQVGMAGTAAVITVTFIHPSTCFVSATKLVEWFLLVRFVDLVPPWRDSHMLCSLALSFRPLVSWLMGCS